MKNRFRSGAGDWKFAPLPLLPVACCTLLPPLLGGLATAGAVVVGGVATGLIVLVVSLGTVFHRRCQRSTDTTCRRLLQRSHIGK